MKSSRPTISPRSIFRPAPFCGETQLDLGDFADPKVGIRLYDLSPSYQRGSVWTADQRAAFVGHLLQGGDVLPIVVQRVPDSGTGEILDGKQRTEAILGWLAGDFLARLDDGREVGPVDFAHLRFGSIRVRFINLPWWERVRFYVRLNAAGTPHTPEQIAAALAAAPKDY
jgi:hypothetical protein